MILRKKKKKILVVDDDKEFLDVIKSIFRKDFDVHFCLNSEEFLKKFMNYFWDVIIVDVDLVGSPENGHIMVRKAMELRNRYPRTIVISGQKLVDLDKIEDVEKSFFHAYIRKTDPEFRGKIIAEVNEAIALGNNEVLILEERFTAENLMDFPIAANILGELNEFGSFVDGFSEKETARSFIKSCKSDNTDKEKIKSILKVLRNILKKHYLEKYEGTK